ncbi:hypothetical protein PGT21_013239 [Puccinia graminis f. sp. tritici]|uniref:Uncharacterized protein n=1 Tax=Puccinia graminis f. sp. tritici TaxID=56615 RepID=A0A5B0QN53_PUCGR|nr:hypothetical protein PGT21_013239 [Puccinia graminis f. sp. tritici]
MDCRFLRSTSMRKANSNQMYTFLSIFILANLFYFPFVSCQLPAPGTTPSSNLALTTPPPGQTTPPGTTNTGAGIPGTNTGAGVPGTNTGAGISGSTTTLATTSTPGTTTNGNPSTGRTTTNPSPKADSLYSCSEAFAPLDEDQTLVFDRPVPEAAGYCKSNASSDNLACALRTCVAFPTCSGCSVVTSSATDSKVTTDGRVLPQPQNCELAYYISHKPGVPSLCLTAQTEVLQCTGGCQNATNCGTCFKVTETNQPSKGPTF